MQQEAYSPKPLDWRAWGRMALAGYWKIAIVKLAYWLQKRIEQLHEELLQHQLAAEVNARRQMQAQLQLLQAQIEPHMLFNTLATLQGLIGFDPARAQEMLEHLIHFLRASLQSARATQTTLDAEFELLTAYLALREHPEESFIDTLRRLGHGPFKTALYGEGEARDAA